MDWKAHNLATDTAHIDMYLKHLADSADGKRVIFFFLCLRKYDLTFHANNLQETLNAIFWEKQEKYFKILSAEINYHGACISIKCLCEANLKETLNRYYICVCVCLCVCVCKYFLEA